MTRKIFLENFLGALGVSKVAFSQELPNSIQGFAFFEDGESQGYCWRISEEEAPSADAFKLVELLMKEKLLDIDKIKVSRSVLLRKYNQRFKTNYESDKFLNILGEVEAIKVNMVDEDGDEGDFFFIHE